MTERQTPFFLLFSFHPSTSQFANPMAGVVLLSPWLVQRSNAESWSHKGS